MRKRRGVEKDEKCRPCILQMVTHGFRFLGNNFNPAHAHSPLLNAIYIWYKWFIMYRFKLLTLHNFRNLMKSHDHGYIIFSHCFRWLIISPLLIQKWVKVPLILCLSHMCPNFFQKYFELALVDCNFFQTFFRTFCVLCIQYTSSEK